MAATGPKLVEIFRDFRILILHTFAPQNKFEMIKKWIFAQMVLRGSNFGHFYGFMAILTPLHCLDQSKIKILAHRAVKWHLSNFYVSGRESPGCLHCRQQTSSSEGCSQICKVCWFLVREALIREKKRFFCEITS